MDGTHLHLWINHLPVVGSALAALLLGVAVALPMVRQGLLVGGVMILVTSGVGAAIALNTGESAHEAVEGLPGVTEGLIHEHEERAELATVLAGLTAIAALGAFVFAGRRADPPAWAPAALGAAALVTFGAMAWTGSAGGQIRHSEIRGQAAPGSAPAEGPRHEEDEDDD